MSKLQEYNGRFCESEYEYAFITLLEKEGWLFSCEYLVAPQGWGEGYRFVYHIGI